MGLEEREMLGVNVRTIIFASLFFLLSSGALGQLAEDIKWANGVVNNAEPKTLQERQLLTEQIIERLGPHAAANEDVRTLIRTLEIGSELLRFEAESMTGTANQAAKAATAAERARHLEFLRASLLDRAATLIQTLAQPDITVQDAKRISDIAKYASQALDDVNDPTILGGASSAYTKFLNRLNGIASLAQAVENPEARSILSGLRGTIGTMDRKLMDLGVSAGNPMKAFDIPAEIAGAVVDTSVKGMDQTSAALDDITKAMDGDAEALARLPRHSQRIEQTLSPRTYGQAMFKAMADRIVDRIPFARTLAKLFGSPTPKPPAASANAKVVDLDWLASGNAANMNEDDIFSCGPNPTKRGPNNIDGTYRYPLQSRICFAAVHSGTITFENGGRFRLRFFPFEEDFQPRASTLNGVTSGGYSWHSLKQGTYVFIRVD